LFRIERNLVKLGGVRTVQLGNETGEVIETATDDSDVEFTHPNINPQELIENAKKKAELILENARNEAADIILAGREEVEVNSRAAWDEGYIMGVEEGKRSYDDQLREGKESLKRIIEEVHVEREHAYASMESDMVDLALQIVRKVINLADESVEGIFESLIKNALRQIAPDDKIMLRVGIADYERYFPEGSAIFELGNGVTVSASILKDISLNDYDVIIDKDDSTVNAGLDSQLMNIQLAFHRG
jgi:flagellar assembly protein FliH